MYKPIQGSDATLNLVVERHGQYPDFSSGLPFEYQLRLRYRDGNGDLQPYWCGFFTPLESTEDVTTFPFVQSFTAVDGLGLLEESNPPRSIVGGQVNAFDTFIVPSLQQIGLNLPIYVQSGLTNNGEEALTTATVDDLARFSDLDGEGELFTNKEIIEGYLSAFNCKITQSNGRWYIYNSSTLTDSTTWKTYTVNSTTNMYEVGSNVTESLLINIDGTPTQDVIPSSDDLQLTLRRPRGSVECRPRDLVERQFAINGNFDNGSTGWDINSSSGTSVVDGQMRIVRNWFSINSVYDNYAFRNATGYQIDRNADIAVSFDVTLRRLFEDSVRMYWRVYATFDSESVTTLSLPSFNIGVGNYQAMYNSNYLNFDYATDSQINRLYWDASRSEWSTNSRAALINQDFSDVNEIVNVSETFRNPTSFFNEFQQAGLANLRFYIEFFTLRSVDGRRFDGSSTTRVSLDIDNISVRNMFAQDVINPTFERAQENHTATLRYEPLFASSISDALLQKINPTEFVEPGGVVTNAGTLEQFGTQWKLNDFGNEFKYYEGNLINNTAIPLTNMNKVLLNWSNYDGQGNNYIETASGIMNGGTFSPKMNKFDAQFYIPDQDTDIAPGDGVVTNGVITRYGFFPHNVDLVPATFPGRSTAVAYTLAFRVDAVDGMDMAIANGLVPTEPFVQFIGQPGTIQNYDLILMPLTGYVANTAATIVSADADQTPLPQFTELGPIQSNSNGIIIPLTITLPETSEFEELFVEGAVVEFTPEATPGVVNNSIVITHNISGVDTPTSITIPVNGVPGSTQTFDYTLSPSSGRQLFAGNFSVNESDTSLTNLDARQVGESVVITFMYSVPTTSESVPVTINGSSQPEGTVGVDLFNRSITFSATETGVGTQNWSLFESSNTFTGLPGQTIDYDLLIVPGADYTVSASSFSTGTLPTGVAVRSTGISQNNQEVIIPLTITIGSSSTSGTLEVSGTAQEEPYSLTFVGNNLGIEGASFSPGEIRRTYDATDFGNSVEPAVTFTLTSAEGMEFTATDQVAIDVGESQLGLPEGQFLVTPTLEMESGVATGNIIFTIAGTYPSLEGHHILDVNVAATAALDALAQAREDALDELASAGPATAGGTSIRSLTNGIGSIGGPAVFELTADGNFNVSIRITGSGIASGQGTDTGTYSVSTTNGLLTMTGGYSPTNGRAGTHLINLEVGQEPMYFNPAGNTGLAISHFTVGISHTIVIHARNNDGSDGDELASATVDQGQRFGGRTITVPDAWAANDPGLLSVSRLKPSWTFYR